MVRWSLTGIIVALFVGFALTAYLGLSLTGIPQILAYVACALCAIAFLATVVVAAIQTPSPAP